MNWRDSADNSVDNNYTAPQVTQQKLDAGGNYVTPAWAMKDGFSKAGAGGVKPLGGTIIE
jgi:hypothetical protein